MRIDAVEHSCPSRAVSNEWVLAQIRQANRAQYSETALAGLEQVVGDYLVSAGTETRFQLDEGELALDQVLGAGRSALESTGCDPDDIDFLIYTGVGRGWVEPAMANVVQAELHLSRATCFDVLDACASWLRALEIAQGLLLSRRYRRGLIVNCECGFYRRYSNCWTIPSLESVAHCAATFTIGEAATATIVSADDPDAEFYFRFATFPQLFRLCLLPLDGIEDFWPGSYDERIVPGRFFALSAELFLAATRRTVETFEGDARLREDHYDVCFGHSPSERVCQLVARRLGLQDVFFSTHRNYGNTVSASIPLAMSIAEKQGRLHRGDKVLLVVGSAGVSVGLSSFRF
jgi:3-oxoacyl-[acyl-carrier-protein] synthase III